MLDLYAELRRIVDVLDGAGIGYAVAGGLAVSIYATPRATEDIDLMIARGDLERSIRALQAAGFRPAGRRCRLPADAWRSSGSRRSTAQTSFRWTC